MPPALVISSVANEAIDGGDFFVDFIVPATAKPRDALIVIVAADDAADGPDFDELGSTWEELAELDASTGRKLWVLRHEVAVGDVGALRIPFDVQPAIGVLIVLRNVNLGAAAVGSSATAIAASTNFVAPSRGLAAYSDLFLGVVLVESAAVAVGHPANTTEVIENQYDGQTLEVFAYYREDVGASGTKTATTGAAQSGIAASIALAADPVIGAGKSFDVDPVGTFGLPSFGV